MKKKMLTRGDFAGNNEISINFDFSHFVRVNGDGNSDKTMIKEFGN
jgi:hypothetical protein